MSTSDLDRKAAQLAADWKAAHTLFPHDRFPDELIAEASGIPVEAVNTARARYRNRRAERPLSRDAELETLDSSGTSARTGTERAP
jgi:hypothetical protein